MPETTELADHKAARLRLKRIGGPLSDEQVDTAPIAVVYDLLRQFDAGELTRKPGP